MMEKHYPGEEASWDTLRNGLVPCVVLAVEDALSPGPEVRIRITQDTGPWKEGEERTTYGHNVIPKGRIKKHKYGIHILSNFIWVPKENNND